MTGLRWTDHACRSCGSRVAMSDAGDVPTYECGNCGQSCSVTPDDICGCGVHLMPWLNLSPRKRRLETRPKTPTGPRFFCTANLERSPQNPSAIIVMFGEPAA